MLGPLITKGVPIGLALLANVLQNTQILHGMDLDQNSFTSQPIKLHNSRIWALARISPGKSGISGNFSSRNSAIAGDCVMIAPDASLSVGSDLLGFTSEYSGERCSLLSRLTGIIRCWIRFRFRMIRTLQLALLRQ